MVADIITKETRKVEGGNENFEMTPDEVSLIGQGAISAQDAVRKLMPTLNVGDRPTVLRAWMDERRSCARKWNYMRAVANQVIDGKDHQEAITIMNGLSPQQINRSLQSAGYERGQEIHKHITKNPEFTELLESYGSQEKARRDALAHMMGYAYQYYSEGLSGHPLHKLVFDKDVSGTHTQYLQKYNAQAKDEKTIRARHGDGNNLDVVNANLDAFPINMKIEAPGGQGSPKWVKGEIIMRTKLRDREGVLGYINGPDGLMEFGAFGVASKSVMELKPNTQTFLMGSMKSGRLTIVHAGAAKENPARPAYATRSNTER